MSEQLSFFRSVDDVVRIGKFYGLKPEDFETPVDMGLEIIDMVATKIQRDTGCTEEEVDPLEVFRHLLTLGIQLENAEDVPPVEEVQ